MNTRHHITTILIFITIFLLNFSVRSQNSSDTLPKPQVAKLPIIRIGAQIGYGCRLGASNNITWFPEAVSKLRNNLNFGADFTFYLDKHIGLGMKYNGIYAQAKEPVPNVIVDGDGFFAPSEKIGIHYMGIFFAGRYFTVSRKHCLFINAGGGYLRYRNSTVVTIGGYSGSIKDISTGGHVAFSADVGYDFFVTKSLAIGLQVSTTIGYLKYENGKELEKRRNVGHVGILLGLRFNK